MESQERNLQLREMTDGLLELHRLTMCHETKLVLLGIGLELP